MDKSDTRRIAGLRAKRSGMSFEAFFMRSCRRNCLAVTQIPSSCKWISKTKITPIRSPFDWIITYKSHSAFLDTKSIDADRFPNSLLDRNQVRELSMHERAGAVGGYVIWFRSTDKICFYKASFLETLLEQQGSITEKEAHIEFGSYLAFDPKILFGPQDVERELKPTGLFP